MNSASKATEGGDVEAELLFCLPGAESLNKLFSIIVSEMLIDSSPKGGENRVMELEPSV